MDEKDPLQKYVKCLGLDGQAYEALQHGDVQTLICNMLSQQVSDPLLAAVIQSMLTQNQGMFAEAARPDEANEQHAHQRGRQDVTVISSSDDSQLATAPATLRNVAQMLGACSACCGEDRSCPKCHGRGRPGSVPSIASAGEFRAWIEPALVRMGMRITDLAVAEDSGKGPAAASHSNYDLGSQSKGDRSSS